MNLCAGNSRTWRLCPQARLHPRPITLRHVDEHAHRIGVGDVKECLAGAIAGGDQLADLDVAGRDRAGERRIDEFERLQRRQPLDGRLASDHIGLGGGDGRFGRGGSGPAFVQFLLAGGVGLREHFVADERRVGQILVGHGGEQSRLELAERRHGLPQFVVDFGNVDFGEQLAGLHFVADIDQPALQVTIGAGIDGRFFEGLHVAGQHQRLAPPPTAADARASRGGVAFLIRSASLSSKADSCCTFGNQPNRNAPATAPVASRQQEEQQKKFAAAAARGRTASSSSWPRVPRRGRDRR